MKVNKIIMGNRVLVEPLPNEQDNFIGVYKHKILKGKIIKIGNGVVFNDTKEKYDLSIFKEGNIVYYPENDNYIKIDAKDFNVVKANKLHLLDTSFICIVEEVNNAK